MPELLKKDARNIIIITRPKSDAQQLAGNLEKQGYDCLIEPMLTVNTLFENAKSLEYALDCKPQAVLVTSKHAITAFSLMTEQRHLPIIAVGQTTANRALNLGFEKVSYAQGTANSLLAHVTNNYSPAAGTLLYIRGVDISTDVASRLTQNDFMVDSVTLYQAKSSRQLSHELCAAINANKVSTILFFSQNTVKTYARLAAANHIVQAHRNITAQCMSSAIAERAKSLLSWKEVILFDKQIRNIL